MKAVFGCLGLLVLAVAIDLFIAWLLWIIYGAVAPIFHWPSIGYWTMFYIMCGLSIVGSFFRSSTSSKK